MKAVTISDVAKQAGVSKSTVSQYLNGRYEYMGIKTKERIERVVKELGYRPNKVTRSLKQKRTATIGVMISNILCRYSTKLVRSIEDVCNREGYQVIICHTDDQPEKEKQYIEMLLSRQVDGIIAMPTVGNIDVYRKLRRRNFPVVFIDRILSDLQVSSLLLDNEKATKMAVDEFVQNGYQRIAIATIPPTTLTPTWEKLIGYKKALEAYGLYFEDDYVIASPVNEVQSKLRKLLNYSNPPEAMIVTNDLIFEEIIRFIKDHRLTIPEDLALIIIDDLSFADCFTPSITTVNQRAMDIGEEAAKLIVKKIETNNTEEVEIYRFEPKINKRESSIRK